MAHIVSLNEDDGFPSDFTHKRVSDALDRKGEILAYKHLLLGWMGPKTAYLTKLVAANAKFVIDKGYEMNFKIMDMLTPQGGLIGELSSIAADVVLFKYLQDYAGEQARQKGTSKEREMALLLGIMCLPFGMVYLVGIAVFKVTTEDWGKIVGLPGEPIRPGEKSEDPLTAILNFMFGLLGPWDPMKLPRI